MSGGLSLESRYCSCEARQRMLRNPDIPVVFDSVLREHHLIYEGKRTGRMILQFCPFCGGRLEESKRGELFEAISDRAVQEIVSQVKDVKDRKGIEEKFGQPAREWLSSELDIIEDAKKGKIQAVLSYSNFSKVANVVFTLWTASSPEVRIVPKSKDLIEKL